MFIETRPVESGATLEQTERNHLTPTVRLAQHGDTRAFEQLYREHIGRVYALCLRLSGSRLRAEELTQDVFVRAWEMLGSFRGESALSTWLHRVAVNVVLVEVRSQQRRDSRVRATDELELYDSAAHHAPAGLSIDLEEAMTVLPPQARAVFVLHDIEGYKHEEIAEQLGVAVGTCKTQLHRARTMLKEVLER